MHKDLSKNDSDYRKAIDPLARELANIRHHLEHKYLKLHEFGLPSSADESISSDDYPEPIAYSLGRCDFQRSALRILKLARAALIYLTLAIRAEEQQRDAQRPDDKLIAPMPLELWQDSWKI